MISIEHKAYENESSEPDSNMNARINAVNAKNNRKQHLTCSMKSVENMNERQHENASM